VSMCGHGTEPFAFQSIIVSMEAEIKVCSQFQQLLCVGRGVCQCQSTYQSVNVSLCGVVCLYFLCGRGESVPSVQVLLVPLQPIEML